MTSQISTMQFAFTAFFAAMYAAMLRRADIWYPFTPTRTHEPGSWADSKDTARWALAFVALLTAPATYFVYMLLFLQEHATSFMVSPFPPSPSDIIKIITVVLLVVPPLAFYNLWQVIVRANGRVFYSERAMDAIRVHYPVAFDGSYANAVAWAFAYLLLPLIPTYFVLRMPVGGS